MHFKHLYVNNQLHDLINMPHHTSTFYYQYARSCAAANTLCTLGCETLCIIRCEATQPGAYYQPNVEVWRRVPVKPRDGVTPLRSHVKPWAEEEPMMTWRGPLFMLFIGCKYY